MSGGSLLDVLDPWVQMVEGATNSDINQQTCLPLYAPDPTAYEVFAPFLNPQIERFHRYKIKEKLV